MGFFGSLLKGIGSLFKGPSKWLDDILEAEASDDAADALKLQREIDRALAEVSSKIAQTRPFAINADNCYAALREAGYNEVPAIDLYDGNYTDKLISLQTVSHSVIEMASSIAEVESELSSFNSNLHTIATQVQTFLREPTSDIDAAKLWDAKFVKALNDHIPPHFRKGEYFDETMAKVMEAYRMMGEINAYGESAFGSQSLINATYEAVEDGDDPLEYISNILDLNSRATFGKEQDLNDNADVIVPNAGLFGGNLLF